MNSRDRTIAALSLETPDRIPHLELAYNEASIIKIARFFTDDLPQPDYIQRMDLESRVKLFEAALLLIEQSPGGLRYSVLAPGAVTPTALLLLLGAAWVRMAQIPFQGWALSSAETPPPIGTLLLGGWGLFAGPFLWLRFVSRTAHQTPNAVAMIAGSISLIVGAMTFRRRVNLAIVMD